jgi:hypothetical protein
MANKRDGNMAYIGVGLFLLGAILFALGITYSNHQSAYVLFGIIMGAAGIGIMYLDGKLNLR